MEKKKFTIGQIVLYIILFLYTLFCFLPILLVAIASFTDGGELAMIGFSFLRLRRLCAGELILSIC